MHLGWRHHRKLFSSNGITRFRFCTSKARGGSTQQLQELESFLNSLDIKKVDADAATYARLLRICSEHRALKHGQSVHRHIVENGLEQNIGLGNCLLNMYGKCGSVENARKVFERMGERNVVSWTSLITAYAQHGNFSETISCFEQMQLEGVIPNQITMTTIVSACAKSEELEYGKMIHAQILDEGYDTDVVLGTALIHMYGECGCLEDALQVFDAMTERSLFAWTAMIAAFAQNGDFGKEAIALFQQMQLESIRPNLVTFVSVLNACGSSEYLAAGKMIHRLTIENRCANDNIIGNALINMYGKCGSPEDAAKVFERMSHKDVISWTATIAAYALDGHWQQALQLFRKMHLEAQKPNKVTLSTMVAACASPDALADGKTIHAQIDENGFGSDLLLGTALVNMYGKCGSPEDAKSTFDRMQVRDIFSWTAMLGAYADNGYPKESLQVLRGMLQGGMKPDKITFTTAINACASMAALAEGRRFHACICEYGLESDTFVANALVDMYRKCGTLEDALGMFGREQHRCNLVLWNAMIAAYAQHGQGKEALNLFEQMKLEGVMPDSITFVGVLHACSHAGLIRNGCEYFVSMIQDFGIEPAEENYHCMVDVLGRSGRLQEAEDFIKRLPCQLGAVGWKVMLGACRTHNDIERGRQAMEHISELDPEDSAPYVILANMYTTAGRWNEASKLRKVMLEKGSKKEPGERKPSTDPQAEEIYSKHFLSSLERMPL